MTAKQRVMTALKHREADRVPTGENAVDGVLAERILGHPTLYNQGWRELEAIWDGRREEVVRDYGRAHVELVRALEWDYVRVPTVPQRKEYSRPRMTGPHSWIDEQGYEVQYNPDSGNIAVRHTYPRLSAGDLPDPDEPYPVDPSELEAVRYVVDRLGESHFIIGRTPLDGSFPWEHTVGMEEFLVRMVTDPAFVEKAVAVYVNRSIAYARAMLEAGVDAIMTTDDYCDNRGPIMGAELFHRFVLPGIKTQCQAIHEAGGYFIKHTDGNTWAIMEDLIGAGIDGWHGIQPAIGMDLATLNSRYGDRLCFFGGVNCETLIEGSAETVRAEVRRAIEGAAAGGGLVATTGNVLQPGTRLENYLVMRKTVREYGAYPRGRR